MRSLIPALALTVISATTHSVLLAQPPQLSSKPNNLTVSVKLSGLSSRESIPIVLQHTEQGALYR